VQPGRTRNPRGRGHRLRAEILQAASELVAVPGGASALSLSGVARHVGVATTSIYLHFPDIDHLKGALVTEGFAELGRVRGQAIEGIADPGEAVLARWRAIAHFGLEHPGHYRLMFGPELPTVLAFDSPDSPGRQAFLAGVDAIRRCQEAGVSRATDEPFRLTAMTWAAVHGLVTLRLDRPNFPWPPLDDMIADTVSRILRLPLR
jgi:AcrR family transcriptional regulator